MPKTFSSGFAASHARDLDPKKHAPASRVSSDPPRPRPTPIRVVLVEDHEAVRAGLIAVLGLCPEIQVVGAAADGCAALDLVRRLQPDVVLMDIRLPTLDGIEATRRIRAEFPTLPVIAMSVREAEDGAVTQILQAGAVTFVSKHGAQDAFVTAVRRYAEQN